MALFSRKSFVPMIILAAMLAAVVYLGWPADKTPGTAGRQSGVSGGASKTVYDKNQYSLTSPASIWIVVNKKRPLSPADYVPSDLTVPNVPQRVPGNESMQLRLAAARALETMFGAAKSANVPLMLSSGYRSYNYQVSLYGSYVKSVGQTGADAVSARPGYSEHQTGLAADIEPLDEKCDVSVCFADLPAGKWLSANAYKYGFIMRYPADKVKVTGYDYEPWHFRYVGSSLAAELHKLHIETLEEFFGLPAAPGY